MSMGTYIKGRNPANMSDNESVETFASPTYTKHLRKAQSLKFMC